MADPLIRNCEITASGAGAIGASFRIDALIADSLISGESYDLAASDGAALSLSGVAYETSSCSAFSSIVPVWGDRGVFDALGYATRHTNDTDDSATAIHHTLGTGADQAAAGDHTHAAVDTVTPVGWLTGWNYRIAIDVANADGTYTNKKVPIDVNTLPLVEADKANADLSDLRVTAADGVSLLPFFRENSALLFNKANFARYASNPIITVGAGGSWEGHWVHPNSVVDRGDGTLHMYYTGNNLPATPGRIGLATSTDGLTWAKDAGNPIVTVGAGGAWDDFLVGDFYAIKEGANWHGWYTGAQSGGAYKIGYATSSDGITWTKSGSNPVLSGTATTWDSASVLAPSVMKIGSTYYMWYFGFSNQADYTTYKIGLATSTDRVTWTKSGSNPVFSGAGSGAWDAGVLDCDVILIGSTYVMAYQGNPLTPNISYLGFATSPDGIAWARSVDNPWPQGGVGTWDSDWNEGPVLYRLGSQWLMYYMGSPGPAGPLQIGVMQFPDTRLWPIIPTLTSAGTRLFVYYGNASATDASTGSAGSPDANVTVTNGSEATPEFASWDDETQPGAHARDIDDATYTLHLNPALNANVGTFGDENNVAQVTVDARGLITAVANVAIEIPINSYNEIQIGTGGTTYYLANEAEPDTVRAYVNGIRQPAENGSSASDVVTFSVAPVAGDTLIFDYELAVT